MYKNKKILAVLSTAAVTGLLISAISSTAFAKTTSIAVNSSDGNLYEYQYNALKESQTFQSLHGSNDLGAKLYNDFLQRKTSIRAYYDDVKKSYIEFDTIAKEALNSVKKGNSFDLNSFTESANTPTTKLTTNLVSVDSSGNLLINGQALGATVDMTTVKCSNAVDSFSTLVSFKLFTSNPQDYTVTIKGKTASMDSTTGEFTAYIDNKLSSSDIKASDFTITKKDISSKPVVRDITIIDSQTIRVAFDKDVNYKYATDISNYQLFNSDGVDISNHIDSISSIAGSSDKNNTDTYVITLKKYNPNNSSDDWRLNSLKYTLKIKNIIDTSSAANVMDDYTCVLNDTDTTAPTVTGIYKNTSASNRIIIYFSGAMDANTLVNRDNYEFTNGEGDARPLPSDTTLTVGGDNKSVIIDFPSSYKILTNTSTTTGKSTDITALSIANVKDKSGNILAGVAYRSEILTSSTSRTCVKDNSIIVRYGLNDLRVDIKFTNAINSIKTSDFTFGGVKPTSSTVSGDMVTLKFESGVPATTSEIAAHPVTYANGKTNTSPTKIDIIKSQGLSAKLAINATDTRDETGENISSTLSENQSRIYDYNAEPRTTPDYWSATKDSNGVKVCITFDTPLDINSGLNHDGFVFISNANGENLKPDWITITGNTVEFHFNPTNKKYSSISDSIGVVCTDHNIGLRTMKDPQGNNAMYVPSENDLIRHNVYIVK